MNNVNAFNSSNAVKTINSSDTLNDHPNSKAERKVMLVASLGSVLEYYDFVVYGMLSKHLSAAFFPQDNETIALLQSFLVFALGYLIRPFGGAFAGIIGDRFGRKPAFLYLTLLMAISTLAIGFLPGYSEWGILAPVLLIICRLLQGLSFAGELPGATTIVAEWSLKKRGFKQSLVIASVSLGALSATFILFLLSTYLSSSEVTAWGWRIPFILGGILGLVLFKARHGLKETPIFMIYKTAATTEQRKPIKKLFQKHIFSILAGIALTAFGSSLIVVNLYFPYYMNHYYNISQKEVYFATTISLIFSVCILPMVGVLADRISKPIFLMTACFSYCILFPFLFQLLSFQETSLLILFMMLHQLFIAFFSACYFPMMVDLFPTEVRYSGIAICYNITYAAMGALPAGLTALLLKVQSAACVPLVLAIMATLTGMASLYIGRTQLPLVEKLRGPSKSQKPR
jgi:MFS family permease